MSPTASTPQDLPRHPAYIHALDLPVLVQGILFVQALNWTETEWLGLDLFILSERGGFAAAVKGSDPFRAMWVATGRRLGAIQFADKLTKDIEQGIIELDERAGGIYLTDKGVELIEERHSRLPVALLHARTSQQLRYLGEVAETGLDASSGHTEEIRCVIRLLAAVESVEPGDVWVGLSKGELVKGKIVTGMPLRKDRASTVARLAERAFQAHGRLKGSALASVIADMQDRRLITVIADSLFLEKLGHEYVAGTLSRRRRP